MSETKRIVKEIIEDIMETLNQHEQTESFVRRSQLRRHIQKQLIRIEKLEKAK